MASLGTKKFKRTSSNTSGVVSDNDWEEEIGYPPETEQSLYPTSERNNESLNFGKITENTIQKEETSVGFVMPQNRTVEKTNLNKTTRTNRVNNNIDSVNNTKLFSKENVNYQYQDTLITEVVEIDSISDNTFLLDYVYKKEKEVGASLPVEAYGVSDSVFEHSTSHEIVTIGNERYLSNKEETLNKENLDLLLSNVSKFLATIGYFDLSLIKKHTFTGEFGTNCIKALSINTYEYNAILGLCDKFNTVETTIIGNGNDTIMRFEKK